jgi:hypothetical protein
MDRNNVSLVDLLIFMRRPLIPLTAGEKRFQIVFVVIFGLLVLSAVVMILAGLTSLHFLQIGLLLLYAALAFVIAGLAALAVWRSRIITSAMQEMQAAGIPILPPTAQERTGCILYGVSCALAFVLVVVILFFWK